MLIKDVEKAIADSGKPNLTVSEYRELKSFLLKCQAGLTPENALIPRVNSALAALEHHKPLDIKWYQKPIGLIIIAAAGGVLTYAILLLLGWVQIPSS